MDLGQTMLRKCDTLELPTSVMATSRRKVPRSRDPTRYSDHSHNPAIDVATGSVLMCELHRKGGGRMTSSDGSSTKRPGEVAET